MIPEGNNSSLPITQVLKNWSNSLAGNPPPWTFGREQIKSKRVMMPWGTSIGADEWAELQAELYSMYKDAFPNVV